MTRNITTGEKWNNWLCLIPLGAETSHIGGSRRFPVRGFMRDWTRRLRLGLRDARPQPVAVRLVRLLPVRPATPGRHGEAQGAALDCREQQHRSKTCARPARPAGWKRTHVRTVGSNAAFVFAFSGRMLDLKTGTVKKESQQSSARMSMGARRSFICRMRCGPRSLLNTQF